MISKVAVFTASVISLLIADSPSSATTRSFAGYGECPAQVARDAMSVAEKACKRQGGEMVVTYMDCENGEISMRYVCM
jgi:hypothetical protein